jgi:hypothetical protein
MKGIFPSTFGGNVALGTSGLDPAAQSPQKAAPNGH